MCSLSLLDSHFFLSENAKDTTKMERENCTNYFQPFQGWFGTTGKQSCTAPDEVGGRRVGIVVIIQNRFGKLIRDRRV